MIDPPQIVQTGPQPAAVLRLTVPRADIQRVMGPGYREVMAAVASHGLAAAGPWFAHHLGLDPDAFDFELGVPVATPITARGRVQPGQLPAATVARTVYRGPYEGLGSAWAQLGAWITAHRHTPAPNFREHYVLGPEGNPDPFSWQTELNRPLAPHGP